MKDCLMLNLFILLTFGVLDLKIRHEDGSCFKYDNWVDKLLNRVSGNDYRW